MNLTPCLADPSVSFVPSGKFLPRGGLRVHGLHPWNIQPQQRLCMHPLQHRPVLGCPRIPVHVLQPRAVLTRRSKRVLLLCERGLLECQRGKRLRRMYSRILFRGRRLLLLHLHTGAVFTRPSQRLPGLPHRNSVRSRRSGQMHLVHCRYILQRGGGRGVPSLPGRLVFGVASEHVHCLSGRDVCSNGAGHRMSAVP